MSNFGSPKIELQLTGSPSYLSFLRAARLECRRSRGCNTYCTYPFNGSVGPGVTDRELTLTETDIEPLLAIGWSYTPKPVYHWKARDKSCPTVYGFGGLRPIFRDLSLPF